MLYVGNLPAFIPVLVTTNRRGRQGYVCTRRRIWPVSISSTESLSLYQLEQIFIKA